MSKHKGPFKSAQHIADTVIKHYPYNVEVETNIFDTSGSICVHIALSKEEAMEFGATLNKLEKEEKIYEITEGLI